VVRDVERPMPEIDQKAAVDKVLRDLKLGPYRLIDEIIVDELASPDLELHWLDEDDGAAENEAALEGRVKLGALTLNEMRERRSYIYL